MRQDPRKRYSNTPVFEWADPASAPFRGLMPRKVARHTGFVEYELKVGDRLDALAQDFYDDPRLWWVILEANAHILLPADLLYAREPDPHTKLSRTMAGTRIIIPRRPDTP